MYKVFKLQFVNSLTQDVLREATYESADKIHDIIEAFERTKGNDEDSFIFDSQHRTLIAEYLAYNTFTEDITMTYKLYFKTKLSKKQVPYRSNSVTF